MEGLTEKQIDDAIEGCKWLQKFEGIYICRGMVFSCYNVINRGDCPTLRELFQKYASGEKDKS